MKRKRNTKKHYKNNKATNKKEKNFFLRFLVCIVIFCLSFVVSKNEWHYFDSIKNFISYTLEESVNIEKTEKDIIEVFSRIKDKFEKEGAVPVDEKDDDEIPMASGNKNSVIMNAYATSEENIESEPVIMRNPAEGIISSAYGERIHPVTNEKTFHNGIDIVGNRGDTVISSAPGKVKKTGEDEYNGKFVVIEHKDNLQTTYIHLDKVCVIKDEIVDDNTKIGEMGDTGMATGVNLHFEIKHKGEIVNPEEYITLPHKNEN